MKNVIDGWTTESDWSNKDYPDAQGAIEMLGAFTQKAGYWEPHEKMIKIRITIEEVV